MQVLTEIPRTAPIAAVAERLGVSDWTLRTWIRQGRLPYHKLGRRVLLRLDDVERFLEDNLRPSTGPARASRRRRARTV